MQVLQGHEASLPVQLRQGKAKHPLQGLRQCPQQAPFLAASRPRIRQIRLGQVSVQLRKGEGIDNGF